MTRSAYCASFCVSFYWTQANDAGDTIPARPTYNSKIRSSAFTYNTIYLTNIPRTLQHKNRSRTPVL
ncbi:hypothetical protein BFL22_15430 [Escherichia coli]|nr:hypothetical protein BFL22_15430 [Escherichia coli]API27039.1 hypothetical protein BFL18_15525 [Escherichia coli]API38271.1 hypothetical protein BFL17_15880 [Escherichia coli]PAU31996.1 hypothetical protein BTQ08_18105 [Escherichia coli]BAB19558.1 hypothetical protein [Enterobacteria phage VT1-Sakai]